MHSLRTFAATVRLERASRPPTAGLVTVETSKQTECRPGRDQFPDCCSEIAMVPRTDFGSVQVKHPCYPIRDSPPTLGGGVFLSSSAVMVGRTLGYLGWETPQCFEPHTSKPSGALQEAFIDSSGSLKIFLASRCPISLNLRNRRKESSNIRGLHGCGGMILVGRFFGRTQVLSASQSAPSRQAAGGCGML